LSLRRIFAGFNLTYITRRNFWFEGDEDATRCQEVEGGLGSLWSALLIEIHDRQLHWQRQQ
jgi:hypothetical protein